MRLLVFSCLFYAINASQDSFDQDFFSEDTVLMKPKMLRSCPSSMSLTNLNDKQIDHPLVTQPKTIKNFSALPVPGDKQDCHDYGQFLQYRYNFSIRDYEEEHRKHLLYNHGMIVRADTGSPRTYYKRMSNEDKMRWLRYDFDLSSLEDKKLAIRFCDDIISDTRRTIASKKVLISFLHERKQTIKALNQVENSFKTSKKRKRASS